MSVPADKGWWLGYLSATIRNSLNEPHSVSKRRLRDALDYFTESAACTDELRAILTGQKDPPRVENHLERDYRMCGNPECCAPIHRSLRKKFCDTGCRKIAESYNVETAEDEFRRAHPDYDQVPF